MSKYYLCQDCGQWFHKDEVEIDEEGERCPLNNPYTHLKCRSHDLIYVEDVRLVAPWKLTEPKEESYEIPGLERTSETLRSFKNLTLWKEKGKKNEID